MKEERPSPQTEIELSTLQRSSVGLANREKTFSGWRYLPLVNSRSLGEGERERRKQRSPQKGGGSERGHFRGQKGPREWEQQYRSRSTAKEGTRKEEGRKAAKAGPLVGPTVSERMMRWREGGRDLGREGRPDSIHSIKLASWSHPSQQGSACMPFSSKHRLATA